VAKKKSLETGDFFNEQQIYALSFEIMHNNALVDRIRQQF
jgi:hypothetical protein